MTALVASGSPDGVPYNVGSLFGAGLFVCASIVAVTILVSPVEIQLTAASFWRDIGLYIVAGLMIIAFGIYGELTWWSSILMLLLYLVLVLVVFLQEKLGSKETNEEKLVEPEGGDAEIGETTEGGPPKHQKLKGLVSKAILHKQSSENNVKHFEDVVRHTLFQIKFGIRRNNRVENEEKKSIWFFIDYPFQLLKRLTLPSCEPEEYSRSQCVFFPCLGVFLMTFFVCFAPAEGTYWSFYWLIALPVGFLLSAILFFLIPKPLKPTEEPPRFFYFSLQAIATIFCLIYTYFVSGILIDLLTFYGMISKLPSTYMGLTVIAIGNALPDGVTTIALAKKKLAVMGMTGAYAGQLFGLLVGFGISMLKKTLSEGPQDFNLFTDPSNLMDVMVIIVSVLVLVISFAFGIICKYRMPKALAYILLGIYACFLVAATIIGIIQIFKPTD